MDHSSLDAHMVQRINVADMLRRSASANGDTIALVDRDEEISFRELEMQVNRLAHEFRAHEGGNPYMVILSANSVDVARVYFACARVGLISVPLHPALTASEIAHVLADTGARLAAVEPRLLGRLEEADVSGQLGTLYLMKAGGGETALADVSGKRTIAELVAMPPVDPVEVMVPERAPVQCLYTSGSTARPKGVLMSHAAVFVTCLSAALHMRAGEEDVGLLNLPMNHVGGLNDSLLTFLTVGAKGVIMPEFDPVAAAAIIERHRVSIGMMSGPMWTAILDAADLHGHDLSSLRRCNVGMANLKPADSERLRRRCPRAAILMASGQTEFNGYQEATRLGDEFAKEGAWGAPTVANEVEIIGEDGRLLPANEVGEIVYRGPQAMIGYLNQPDLTNESFAGGWFRTGDLGYIDSDHVVWFIDRKKNMIKTGGENVSPQEVAETLLAHEDVAECAVIGLSHERWTEAVTAIVKPRIDSAIDEATLRAHCRKRLAAFKVPKKVIFVESLPRGPTGKLLTLELRERYRDFFMSDAALPSA